MAIEKTFVLECDLCRRLLEDSDGLVWGSGKYLREKADLAGWVRFPDGWACSPCAAAERAKAAPADKHSEDSHG